MPLGSEGQPQPERKAHPMPGWTFGAHPGILSLLLSLLSHRSREITVPTGRTPRPWEQRPAEGRVCMCWTAARTDAGTVPSCQSLSTTLSWSKAGGSEIVCRSWPGSPAAQLLGTINQSSLSGAAPSGRGTDLSPRPLTLKAGQEGREGGPRTVMNWTINVGNGVTDRTG